MLISPMKQNVFHRGVNKMGWFKNDSNNIWFIILQDRTEVYGKLDLFVDEMDTYGEIYRCL